MSAVLVSFIQPKPVKVSIEIGDIEILTHNEETKALVEHNVSSERSEHVETRWGVFRSGTSRQSDIVQML